MNPAYLRAVSDAARYVRNRLPRGNTIELQDLVQVGHERVLRYVREGSPPVVVFICAKQGMLDEARSWGNRPRDSRTKASDDPATYPVHRWPRHTEPDIEFLLDLKRELFRMPLHHAAAWYSRHVLDEPVGTIGDGLGVSRGSVCLYEMAARKRLRDAVEAGEPLRRSETRILGTAALRRNAVERERYAELRRLGATVRAATNGAKSVKCYSRALSILVPPRDTAVV